MSDASCNPFLLDEADCRAIVRLLAAVAVERGGLIAQKRRLVEGISDLVGADRYMWNVTRFVPDAPPIAVSLLHNWPEPAFAALSEWNYTRPDNEFNVALAHELATHGQRPYTRSMRQLAGPDWWEAEQRRSDAARRVGLSDTLFCAHPIPDQSNILSILGLARRAGGEPWTPREARLAHIVFSEVSWLHVAEVVPQEDGRTIAPLPPRQQTVLTLLIDGKVPKEIATSLGLSVNTVRTYVRDIYSHFNVSGRAELLRRFMTGDGGDRVK